MIQRIDDNWTQGKHLFFHNLGHIGRVTNIYDVLTEQNIKLGEIRWFSRWRKYTFNPWTNTVFEETCLRDIAQFLEEETAAHKAKKL